MMVRDFQMCIGEEAKEQFKEMTGLLPDAVIACVGGGSNSIGTFVPFVGDPVRFMVSNRWDAGAGAWQPCCIDELWHKRYSPRL